MRMEFDGKTAIVTGGSDGIGRACAERLHQEGASVVIADIDVEQGSALAGMLGDRAIFVETDMRDLAAVQAMADAAVAQFGGIDVLVNNAARAISGLVDEIDEDNWSTVIDINLSGYWRAMRVSVPEMRKRGGGAIVNMSSVQGLRGFSGWPAYAAAKGCERTDDPNRRRFGPCGHSRECGCAGHNPDPYERKDLCRPRRWGRRVARNMEPCPSTRAFWAPAGGVRGGGVPRL